MLRLFFCLLLFSLAMTVSVSAENTEYLPGVVWQEPPVVDPGATDAAPPSDAVVLFDGSDLSAWDNGENWPVKKGIAYSGKGYITTKEQFGDCQLHVEWSAPLPTKDSSQSRGNSGVFLMGIYEVQVLDSYDNPTYFEGQAASVYKQSPPMVNAMRKPGEWNTYDIFWTCPRFKEGQLTSPAYVTVVHNGVLVLNHFELQGDTPWHRPAEYNDIGPRGPIALQDHGNPVRFRNIWVRELTPLTSKPREPMYHDHDSDKKWPAEK